MSLVRLIFHLRVVYMVGTDCVTFSKIILIAWGTMVGKLSPVCTPACGDAYFTKFLHQRKIVSLSLPQRIVEKGFTFYWE